MTRWTLVCLMAALGACQTAVLANCPSLLANEIFCDDFDTYCSSGGYPASPGDPGGAHCDPLNADETGGNPILREVWLRTSLNEASATECGVNWKLETDQMQMISPPDGARSPKGSWGQQTVKDWIAPNPFGLARFVGGVFGTQYAAVAGTDGAPLTLEFYTAASGGKIEFSGSYIELGFGDNTYLNRANTDFVIHQVCDTYCNPPIAHGPHPILCAQGNPLGAMPGGCPSAASAPVHNAIAVGALSVMDTDPCHCGSVLSHEPQNSHLTLYDGQLWWALRSNTPVTSTGTVTPKDGATMPPPTDIPLPGDFVLSGGANAGKSSNMVKLTLTTSAISIELTSLFKSGVNLQVYEVSNVMENIPRQYTGPFDQIRGGVGSGCALNSNTDWGTCATGTDRSCLVIMRGAPPVEVPIGYYVDFDDVILHGGVGYSVNGACCLANASCVDDLTQSACQAQGGRWQGSSTTCVTLTCCPYPFADGDHDGDVDQDDFGLFQVCYTGTGGGVPTGCSCFDRNHDNSIDGLDFSLFANCFTGANVAWSQSLTPSCTP